MIVYNARVANFTASTANSIIEFATNASRSVLVVEIDVEGDGTTSAYMEGGLYRVTAIGTGTAQTAVTAVAVVSPSTIPTLQAVVGTGAWGTAQATLAANPVHSFPVNQNGQRYFWRANPNLNNAITVPGGGSTTGTLSARFSTMPGNASIRLQLAEF
jgi:hypothetical protein